MKKSITFILVLGIIAGAWILYIEFTEVLDEQEQYTREKEKRTVHMYAEKTPDNQSAHYPDTSSQTSPNTPSMNHQARTQQAQRQPALSKRDQVLAIAREEKVKILTYNESGNQATVVCEASEHNQLGDFLDTLVRRSIIRDFDYNNKDFSVSHDRNLQRFYRCKYILKW